MLKKRKQMKVVTFVMLVAMVFTMLMPAFANAAIGSFAPSGTTGSMDNPEGFKYRAPIGITSNITGPIPTNDWWSGLLVRNEVQTISPHPLVYSTCTTSYPAEGTGFGLAVHFKGAGYVDTSSLGPLDGVTRTKWNVSAYVQPAFLIWNNLMDKASTTFKVDGYGDWHINLDAVDAASHKMTSVLSSGSPYTYYTFSNGSPKLRINSWGGFIDYYDPSGNAVMTATNSTFTGDRVLFKIKHPVTQEVTIWALFSAPGTVWTRSAEYLTVTIGGGANYLVSAILPSQADFDTFYNHAYAKVSSTTSNYVYDEATAKITTTFTTGVTMLRPTTDGFSNTIISSLFPHQYKHLGVGYAVDNVRYYDSMRGKMKLYIGNEFKTVLTNYGILTTFNEPTGSAGYSHANAVQWLNEESNQVMDDQGTKMVNAYNVASYEQGKALFRNAQNMDLASKLGQTALSDQYKSTLYDEFKNWFTYSPGQEKTFWADNGPYGFFTYNPPTGGAQGRGYGALTPYRAGFGVQAMNDMHFHFGYWIEAASLMAMYHPTFTNDFSWAIDEIIRNIASPDRADSKYPYLRYFSPYKGRSFASGWYWDDNYRGNDMESTSESMNAWQAIYQWGQITGNKSYRDLGLYLYWTEKSAIDEYWLDVDNENFNPQYPHILADIVRENNYEFNVYWGGSHYEELYGIQMLPLHAGMLYLGLNHTYAENYWNTMTASHRAAKGTDFDFWKAEMIKYRSMIDPTAAISKYQYNPTRVANEELLDEDTWSATYSFIHNMNQLGRPSTAITADKPSYGVFDKGGAYTYVGFNPSATTPLTINFKNSSGSVVYTMSNIPPRTTVYSNAVTPTIPAAPTGLTATAASSSQVNLTWTDNASNETGYKVYVSTTNTKPAASTALAAGTTSYSATGLTANTTYYFWVEAYNTAGSSAAVTANATTQNTTPTVPAAPTGLTATAASTSQINLSWTDNASNETGYKVYRNTTNTKPATATTTLAAGATSCNCTGLTSNTTYYFWVEAYNTVGSSTAATANATTQSGTVTTLMIDDYNSAAQWNNNLNDLGQSIVRNGGSYNLEGDKNLYFFYNGGSSPESFDNYINRDISGYGNLVINICGGAGGEQSSISMILNDGTDHQVSLGTYGSVTTAYQDISIPLSAFGANLAKAKFIRFQGTGTAKTVRIKEMKLTGSGTTPTIPAAPTGLTATAASTSQINLAWTDNASNETGYKVYVSTTNTKPAASTALAAGTTSYSATGLTVNTTYYFWVEAYNTAGSSAAVTANATTQNTTPTVPAAPTGLTATAASTSQINLAWTDNASNETGYKVYRNTTNTKPSTPTTTLGANVTTCVCTGLAANTIYYFWVEAYNTAGSSTASTASATTQNTAGLTTTTWYLYNQAVSGVTPAGQNMQSNKDSLTGWQPTKAIGTTASYWYTPALSGTYSSGTWTFTLWSTNNGSSNIKVDLYKVSADGVTQTLLGTQTMDVGTSGGGNHPTAYTFSQGAVSLNNERLMVKITKVSGADVTACYNTNDFPTRLQTP